MTISSTFSSVKLDWDLIFDEIENSHTNAILHDYFAKLKADGVMIQNIQDDK